MRSDRGPLINDHSVLIFLSNVVPGDNAPLLGGLLQVVRLGIAVARVVHGTDENDAGAGVIGKVLVKVVVVVEVGEHEGRGRVQRGNVSRLGEGQVDEVGGGVLADPPRTVHLDPDHLQTGRLGQEPLEEPAAAPHADDLQAQGPGWL